VMTTRWAYEAIAVEQFRSGKYMKPYFTTEMMISRYDWQSSFLIPELKKKSRECVWAWGKPEFREAYEGNIEKLNYHIATLSKEENLDPSNALRVIAKEPFTSDDAYIVNDYLDTLQKVIRRQYLYYTDIKDQITDSLTRAIGHEELVRLRETTHNEELADLALNRLVQKKVYDTPDRIIQKSDPVLMGPVSRNGRAHFYAPYKMVGNLRIGTLWFNLLYIWWANTNFFITLYFDLLRKLLNLSDKRSITGFGILRMGAR
jgi:ABC transport system ATP-binding/permease protein